MSAINFCPGCGRKIPPPADAFCPHCGAPLRRDERTRQTPPAPTRAQPRVETPPRETPRAPYQWMQEAEAPKPVVPLAPTPAQQGQKPAPAPAAPAFAPPSAFACPDCGGVVQRGAFICQRCGRRFAPAPPQQQAFQPPKPFSENLLGILLIALLAAVVIAYFC